MANRLLVTITIPIVLGTLFAFSPAGSRIQEGLVSQLSPSGEGRTKECSTLPMEELRGVVFMDSVLSNREKGGTFLAPNNYVEESMRHISMRGMNLVRVPFYWEAYVNNSAAFVEELKVVARSAAENDICVIFDNHHWYTSSHWGIGTIGDASGRGFPSFVVRDFPVLASESTYQSTAAPFWAAFLRNEIIIDGKSVWDLQMEFLAVVISEVDQFDNVVGYEILNEPHLFDASQYEDLGNYHTYIAREIRELTDKRIFFNREVTVGFQRLPALEYKIVPQYVSGVVYAPHIYSELNGESRAEEQLAKFKEWSEDWGVQVLIGEWSASSQDETDMYVNAFKENEFGWTYYSWTPIQSRGKGVSLYDAELAPSTEGLKQLSASIERVHGTDESLAWAICVLPAICG